jgi:hypothetical protein
MKNLKETQDMHRQSELFNRIQSSSSTSLYLSSNSDLNSGPFIGNSGAYEIAEALKVNKILTYLDLSGNKIGDDGAKKILEALKVNKTLIHLDLSGNRYKYPLPELGIVMHYVISDEIMNKIENLLKRNRTLKSGLINSVKKGDIAGVKTKLDEGVSLLTQDDEGNNLLHLAVIHNLPEKKGDTSVTAKFNKAVGQFLGVNKHSEIVEYLLTEMRQCNPNLLTLINTTLMLAEKKRDHGKGKRIHSRPNWRMCPF